MAEGTKQAHHKDRNRIDGGIKQLLLYLRLQGEEEDFSRPCPCGQTVGDKEEGEGDDGKITNKVCGTDGLPGG